MEEQIVSFETAKLAKEKGFYITGTFHNIYTSKNEDLEEVNNICLKYDEDGYDFLENYRENYLEHFDVISWRTSANFIRFSHPEYLAPTQSLLQKWLREVHNIVIIIDFSLSNLYNNNKKSYFVDIYCLNINIDNRIKSKKVGYESPEKDHKLFDTYEEALEEGLKEALKLV